MAGCFVPPQHAHRKWHVIRTAYPTAYVYERAEWVADNGSGHPIWVRWGRCGDFATLCSAEYVGPAIDQHAPYARPDGLDAFEFFDRPPWVYNPQTWRYEPP